MSKGKFYKGKYVTQKANKNTRHEIIKAAFELIAQDGWESFTLSDVAKKIDMPFEDVQVYFEDKNDILAGFGRMVDQQVLENIGENNQDQGVPARDLLFDLLMERYEVLNEYRQGITSVLDTLYPDYSQSLVLLPHLASSMQKMLKTAGIDVNGVKGALKITGLTIVYLKVLRDWKDDDSPDLQKTMAALDGALGYADRAAGYLGV